MDIVLSSPGPVIEFLGPMSIRWYGLLYVVAFLAMVTAANKIKPKSGLTPDDIVNIAFAAFIGGIAGARLYYVMLSVAYFAKHLLESFAVWHGGMSIHGGILGALLSGWCFCRSRNIPFWSAADLLGASVPLGQAIGRWGNFFNSEAFGIPVKADFPLKLFIPASNRPLAYQSEAFFQPTFIYEATWDFGLWIVLFIFICPRLRKRAGATFSVYLMGYSVGRLIIEPLRTDSIMAGTTQIPMIASAMFLVAGIAGFLFVCSRDQATRT